MKSKKTNRLINLPKYITVFCLFSLFSIISFATPITIGTTPVEIPNPKGFISIDEKYCNIFQMQKQFYAPGNELYLFFIPEADIPKTLKNPSFVPQRSFYVGMMKSLVAKSVSSSSFEEIKNTFKEQNRSFFDSLSKQMPDLLNKLNNGYSDYLGQIPSVASIDMIPLPPHFENNNILCFSSYRRQHNTSGKYGQDVISTNTLSIVLVKGKVLFLSLATPEDDLAWSRAASQEWAQAIIAANTVSSNDESILSKIDFSFAIKMCFIALFLGVIGWRSSRRKKT